MIILKKNGKIFMPSKLNALRIYVSDEENEQIKAEAKKQGLSVSNYFRKKAGFSEILRGKYERKKQTNDTKNKK